MTDAFSETACALSADIDEPGVAGDLIEGGEGALGLGEQVAVEVGLKLQQGIVDAQPVIFHPPLEKA